MLLLDIGVLYRLNAAEILLGISCSKNMRHVVVLCGMEV